MLHTVVETFFFLVLNGVNSKTQDDLLYFRNGLFIPNVTGKYPVICFPLSKRYGDFPPLKYIKRLSHR